MVCVSLGVLFTVVPPATDPVGRSSLFPGR